MYETIIPYRTFQADHVIPLTKTFNISTIATGVTMVQLLHELKLCQLLCYEHHLLKTKGDREAAAADKSSHTISVSSYQDKKRRARSLSPTVYRSPSPLRKSPRQTPDTNVVILV